MNPTRPGLNVHIARSGQTRPQCPPLPVWAYERSRNVLCPNASAAGLRMRASSDVPQADLARAGLGLHLGAYPLDTNVARAAVSLHRGIGWDGDFVADRNVPAHILRQVVADANAIPVLLNGRDWIRRCVSRSRIARNQPLLECTVPCTTTWFAPPALIVISPDPVVTSRLTVPETCNVRSK